MALDSFLHSLAEGYVIGDELRTRAQRRKLIDLEIKDKQDEIDKRNRAREYLRRAEGQSGGLAPQLQTGSEDPYYEFGRNEGADLASRGISPATVAQPQQPDASLAAQGIPALPQPQPQYEPPPPLYGAQVGQQTPQPQLQSDELRRLSNAASAFRSVREDTQPVPAVRAGSPAAAAPEATAPAGAKADAATVQMPKVTVGGQKVKINLPEFDHGYADRLRNAARLALEGGDHDIADKYMKSYADYIKQQADVYDKFVTTNLNPLIRWANELAQKGQIKALPEQQKAAINAIIAANIRAQTSIAAHAIRLAQLNPGEAREVLRKVTGIDNLHDLSDNQNVVMRAFPPPQDPQKLAEWRARVSDMLVATDSKGRPIHDEDGQPIFFSKRFIAELVNQDRQVVKVGAGESLVQVDPATGKAKQLYQGPQKDNSQSLTAKQRLDIGAGIIRNRFGYNPSGMAIPPKGLAEAEAAYYQYMLANPGADPAEVGERISKFYLERVGKK